jgi:gliding motility-associated-like protein
VVDELPQYCENEEFSLFVPNAFTPDGDFTNDTFRVELLGGKLDEGYIFNRWGNEIKRFDNDNREWDGKTTSGEPVQDGVYTYVLFYTPTNKTRETVHGFVTVIR